ncbi:hypothetical protein EG327_001453 [Venturia inaequalis]|uniref:Uncharacterized protein n=1 Tax=Venturia inaequalis TaxID=5025 RepID=A0A8H3VS71_VENIN|nr:hypothetical protein EG327_001453 [Venturia inaequalis]
MSPKFLLEPLEIINSYALGTGAWLALQATPLLLTPKLIITMLSEEMHEPSSLETYLSRTSGLTLLFFALLTTLLTGALPLTSTPSADESTPYATPTLLITLTYHTLTAFYLYANYTQTGISGNSEQSVKSKAEDFAASPVLFTVYLVVLDLEDAKAK